MRLYRRSDLRQPKTRDDSLCPKKPRPMRPEDFRHLTLLNADLKLLSRILANRIRPWLATLLHPSQHCGIQGHNIFQAIAGVLEAITYTECTRTSMCVLSLDFKEAIDNISHDYLFQILKKYGFSRFFQQYVRFMYQNATTSIHIKWSYDGQNPHQLLGATEMSPEHAALRAMCRPLHTCSGVHLAGYQRL